MQGKKAKYRTRSYNLKLLMSANFRLSNAKKFRLKDSSAHGCPSVQERACELLIPMSTKPYCGRRRKRRADGVDGSLTTKDEISASHFIDVGNSRG